MVQRVVACLPSGVLDGVIHFAQVATIRCPELLHVQES